MKKMIALCMAAVMSLALLAGCTSADPNNPYGQEPAEGNPGATTEEILADVMAHGHNGPYEPVLPKIRALFGEDKEYYYFTWNSNFNYRAGEEEECIAKINAGFENWGFTFVNTHNNAHKAVAGLPTQEDLGAALNGYCSALYLYNAVYGETVADRNNGLLTDADIPGNDDAIRAVKLLSATIADAIIEGRSLYTANHAEEKIFLTDDTKNHYVSCAMPIFAEGDVIGCVASVGSTDGKSEMLGTDTEVKLIQTAAGFLGRQLES